jgi:hypothetical protein
MKLATEPYRALSRQYDAALQNGNQFLAAAGRHEDAMQATRQSLRHSATASERAVAVMKRRLDLLQGA